MKQPGGHQREVPAHLLFQAYDVQLKQEDWDEYPEVSPEKFEDWMYEESRLSKRLESGLSLCSAAAGGNEARAQPKEGAWPTQSGIIGC